MGNDLELAKLIRDRRNKLCSIFNDYLGKERKFEDLDITEFPLFEPFKNTDVVSLYDNVSLNVLGISHNNSHTLYHNDLYKSGNAVVLAQKCEQLLKNFIYCFEELPKNYHQSIDAFIKLRIKDCVGETYLQSGDFKDEPSFEILSIIGRLLISENCVQKMIGIPYCGDYENTAFQNAINECSPEKDISPKQSGDKFGKAEITKWVLLLWEFQNGRLKSYTLQDYDSEGFSEDKSFYCYLQDCLLALDISASPRYLMEIYREVYQ